MNKQILKKELKWKDKLEEELSKFISLMSDMTLKTLWVKGEVQAKEFLTRVISYAVGFDIGEYTLFSNELGQENYNKVDMLLVSPDKKTKINVELKKRYTKELIHKNDSYILGGDTYAGLTQEKKYSFNIRVIQVNINGFKSHYDTEFTINEYSLSNKRRSKKRLTYVYSKIC